jgi:hypothetical protein
MTREKVIEALRKAQGPDRELDFLICEYVEVAWRETLPVTASIDAALALVERLLPPMRNPLNSDELVSHWPSILNEAIDHMWINFAPEMPIERLPIAILIVLLTALKENDNAE